MALTFERSPDTDAVISILKGCNDEISYVELARRAGLGEKRMKSVLRSARSALAKNGVLFGTVVGEGLRRLNDQDKVKKPEAFKKRVMRGSFRELKHLDTIGDFGALSKTDQHSVTLNRTLLNAMRQSASVKPNKLQPPTAPLPMANVEKLRSMK